MSISRSPYQFSTPVTDPELLENRHLEIEVALDAVACSDGAEPVHALIVGPQRSGRTSVLLEVARRARLERARLPVWLRLPEETLPSSSSLTRHLLTAMVETMARQHPGPPPPWYSAWRDRVYLRSTAPSTDSDLLGSSLILATDREGEIDPSVFLSDLETLRGRAAELGFSGFLIVIDDATELTQDVALLEHLVESFDAVDDFRLALAGLPEAATHFFEAASPCLRRLRPVVLRPFRGPHQVWRCLRAPLEEEGLERLPERRLEDAGFVHDLLRLTGGNPFELMLVAHHLWLACEMGEQDHFALTARVFDRLIPHLSVFVSGGEELRLGAEAMDSLSPEQMRQALDLTALSGLSVRQIAIARCLGITSRDAETVDRGILTADLNSAIERVRDELQALQAAGVIQLTSDSARFVIPGGRAASVLLKYKARARVGEAVSSRPFDLDFLLAVGRPLARDAMTHTLRSFEGATSLGSAAVEAQGVGSGRLSPRPAVRELVADGELRRLVDAEIDLLPWTNADLARISELVAERDPAIALAYTAIADDQDQLEYLELWEWPGGLDQHALDERFAAVSEDWAPIVEKSELRWRGSEAAVVTGGLARRALILLLPWSATMAVNALFSEWMQNRDGEVLGRAAALADEAGAAMRESGLPDRELGGQLSAILSRLGFLTSFDDNNLEGAGEALQEALRVGAADGWVTRWNLANIAAREGRFEESQSHLLRVSEDIAGWEGSAFVLFFAPGQAAEDCLVTIHRSSAELLLKLQRSLVRSQLEATEIENLRGLIEECGRTGNADIHRAASFADSWAATATP